MKDEIPVLHPLSGEGTMPTPPRAALEEIRAAWLAWAKEELSDREFAAGVAESLERAGYPVIKN